MELNLKTFLKILIYKKKLKLVKYLILFHKYECIFDYFKNSQN